MGSTENLDNLLPLAAVRQGTSLESSKAYRTDTTESDGSCSLGMVKHVVSRTRPRGNRGSGAVHPREDLKSSCASPRVRSPTFGASMVLCRIAELWAALRTGLGEVMLGLAQPRVTEPANSERYPFHSRSVAPESTTEHNAGSRVHCGVNLLRDPLCQ